MFAKQSASTQAVAFFVTAVAKECQCAVYYNALARVSKLGAKIRRKLVRSDTAYFSDPTWCSCDLVSISTVFLFFFQILHFGLFCAT